MVILVSNFQQSSKTVESRGSEICCCKLAGDAGHLATGTNSMTESAAAVGVAAQGSFLHTSEFFWFLLRTSQTQCMMLDDGLMYILCLFRFNM